MTNIAFRDSFSYDQKRHLHMLIGTYTDGNESRGIYLFDFNQDNASFSVLDTEYVGNPSFVVPSADKKHVYAVCEYDNGAQSVAALSLSENKINLLNTVSTNGRYDGGAPCNVLTTGKLVITSNYMGGSLSAFPILHDGTLACISSQFTPEVDYQRPSHIHCALLSPEGEYMFAMDLGHDAIYRFTVNEGSNPFNGAQIAYQFDREVHSGPRHMIFSHDGRFAYLVHELGDLITVFAYNNGSLRHITTEKAYDGGGHGSADIHISPDGRFLYTSHRLKDDGISIYSIDPGSGTPRRIGFQPTGIHPRNFAITPNGKYLLCACRDSNRIEIYTRNDANGALSPTGRSIEIPAPVCVQFILE